MYLDGRYSDRRDALPDENITAIAPRRRLCRPRLLLRVRAIAVGRVVLALVQHAGTQHVLDRTVR